MAEFTVYFNVQDASPEDYLAFIENLRQRLGVSSLHNLLPVLPQQGRSYFHVVLQTENGQITLRIQRGNLYLVGYQMGSTGTWWEFKSDENPPSQLIHGSSPLGYSGGYDSLENAAGVSLGTSVIAGVHLSRRNVVTLGQYSLIGAVNALNSRLPERDKDNDNEKKKAERKKAHEKRAQFLIVVIRMICESIRFTPISDYIFTHYQSDFHLEERMMDLERNWGQLSQDFRAVPFQPRQLNDGTNIETVEQMANILAIVKGLAAAFAASCSKHTKRFPRDVDYGQCLHGRPLAEVFSVCINDIDGQDEDNLYGNITITDGLGSQNIFKDGELIHKGKNACLIGPVRSISAYDSFTINLDLKDRYRIWFPPILIPITTLFPREHEVSHGQISWNVYNATNKYDKLLSKEVRSQYGSVTVNYAVLSDAVEATVEVTFENNDGKGSAEIYEWITASNGVSESELFRKAKNEPIYVTHGETIPLSRSVVAVPLNNALIVSAKLWHHNTIFPDYEIVKDTAQFPPQFSGAMEKKISGEYGEIKVKVTWNKFLASTVKTKFLREELR